MSSKTLATLAVKAKSPIFGSASWKTVSLFLVSSRVVIFGCDMAVLKVQAVGQKSGGRSNLPRLQNIRFG